MNIKMQKRGVKMHEKETLIHNINKIHTTEMGVGRISRNLDINGLLSSDVFIPSIKEQYAIAKVISTSDKQVDLLKQKLVKLEEQKKGLMQVLLTGKVRLQVEK